MTIRDVAEFLKVTEKTIYRMAADGRIPGFKVGGTWRFDKADIEKWIAENKNTAKTKHSSGEEKA
jgi:excisionase family DNA binding protein